MRIFSLVKCFAPKDLSKHFRFSRKRLEAFRRWNRALRRVEVRN